MDGGTMDLLRWQDWAGNFSYCLLALSYLVTNMLWLRTLAVASLGLESVYLYFGADTPLRVGLGWNAVFISIKLLMLILLVREHRSARLSEQEARLHRGLFSELNRVAFNRLLRIGRWVEVPRTARLTIEGRAVEELLVLASGLAKVDVAGRIVAILQPGSFVGEMSLITGETASATVTTLERSRLFAVPKRVLAELLARDQEIESGMHRTIGRDLTVKLRSGWESIGV